MSEKESKVEESDHSEVRLDNLEEEEVHDTVTEMLENAFFKTKLDNEQKRTTANESFRKVGNNNIVFADLFIVGLNSLLIYFLNKFRSVMV